MVLSFDEAYASVVREVMAARAPLPSEVVPLDEADGRVLAADVRADRDQPPFHRSTRDGYAVRSREVTAGARLAVIGEAPAGRAFAGAVGPGQAVEIMTGAPVPDGADAVVMVEHARREGAEVVLDRAPAGPGDNVVARGSEARAGAALLTIGARLGVGAIGLLASVGCGRPRVFRVPQVAVVATGDELVGVDDVPSPTQIRNSNAVALAAAVRRAGGRPLVFPVARDNPAHLRGVLEEAVAAGDMLLVSGGVSAGKHDHVEGVLGALGARVVFDGVKIRPGRPLVFGFVGGKPFFGLPGNPVSTLVTFGIFGRAALDLLAGEPAPRPVFVRARLASDFAQRQVPLLCFVPAIGAGDGLVRAVGSQGSGDLAALGRALGFVVVEPETAALAAGADVRFLPVA